MKGWLLCVRAGLGAVCVESRGRENNGGLVGWMVVYDRDFSLFK